MADYLIEYATDCIPAWAEYLPQRMWTFTLLTRIISPYSEDVAALRIGLHASRILSVPLNATDRAQLIRPPKSASGNRP